MLHSNRQALCTLRNPETPILIPAAIRRASLFPSGARRNIASSGVVANFSKEIMKLIATESGRYAKTTSGLRYSLSPNPRELRRGTAPINMQSLKYNSKSRARANHLVDLCLQGVASLIRMFYCVYTLSQGSIALAARFPALQALLLVPQEVLLSRARCSPFTLVLVPASPCWPLCSPAVLSLCFEACTVSLEIPSPCAHFLLMLR